MKVDIGFWYHLMLWVSETVLLLAALSGLARWRFLAAELRYLVGLAWFGLGLELVAHVLAYRQQSNVWLMPLDAAGELWLLSMVYARALNWPTFTRWRPWLAGGFVAYAAVVGYALLELDRYKTGVLVLESLLVLAMAGLYFRKLLNELRVPRLAADPVFWVSVGLLLYCLGKLLIALFGNFVLEHYSRALSQLVWTINVLLSVVLYLCYLRALWLRPQK